MSEGRDIIVGSLQSLRAKVRRAVSGMPAIYLPIRRFKKPDTVVTPATQLLIEGFPRSGNTWAEAVVRHCGDATLKVAHHSHAAAHVMAAAKMDVASLILFRDPDAAVVSYLTLYANAPQAADAYLDYVTFYQKTWPYAGTKALFVSFEDITQRPTDVIKDLNSRFGLSLQERDLTQQVEKDAVVALMDAKALSLTGNASASHAKKSDARKAQEAIARQAIDAPSAANARKAAQDLYRRMVEQMSVKAAQS